MKICCFHRYTYHIGLANSYFVKIFCKIGSSSKIKYIKYYYFIVKMSAKAFQIQFLYCKRKIKLKNLE